jgi:catechol 2,3-dioxygenase-like lactoylglutathione lyase family enzyme
MAGQIQTALSRHQATRLDLATLDSKGIDIMPRIIVTSIYVHDQTEALRFYSDILGFVKKNDIPLGEARWLTVVSPDDPDGTELLLEPADHPAVKPFRDALFEDGIPSASFGVTNVEEEYDRLTGLGVDFTQKPLQAGSVTTAVLDDTCGNLIQLAAQG